MTGKKQDGNGLADFVRALPEGQRHNGFYWAAKTAVEDNLPAREIAKIRKAGVEAGLDEAYVKRTLGEAEDDT